MGADLRRAALPIPSDPFPHANTSEAYRIEQGSRRVIGLASPVLRLRQRGDGGARHTADRRGRPDLQRVGITSELADKLDAALQPAIEPGDQLLAVTLRLKTTDGEKLKLTMMRGTGPLGGLGGGEQQQLGVEALGDLFGRHASGPG